MPPFDHITRLVDTNVVSYLISQRPADQALAERYRPHLLGQHLAVAFQTWAELRVGAELLGWDRNRFAELTQPFEVIPWNDELLDTYVELRARAYLRNRQRRSPRLSAADGWIAATAAAFDIPLVTHDRALSVLPEITVITELSP